MEQGMHQYGTNGKVNRGRSQQRSPPEVPCIESTKLSTPLERPPKKIDLPDMCAKQQRMGPWETRLEARVTKLWSCLALIALSFKKCEIFSHCRQNKIKGEKGRGEWETGFIYKGEKGWKSGYGWRSWLPSLFMGNSFTWCGNSQTSTCHFSTILSLTG